MRYLLCYCLCFINITFLRKILTNDQGKEKKKPRRKCQTLQKGSQDYRYEKKNI